MTLLSQKLLREVFREPTEEEKQAHAEAVRKEAQEYLRKAEEEARAAVQKTIESLREESTKKNAEADRVERLAKRFPDLRKHTNRWNKVRYYSKTVNEQAKRFDISHNCGCCSDSPLEVWPYIETPDGNVYSDPPCFTVGERNYDGGDDPRTGWDDRFREAGIPEGIIGAVGMHFRRSNEDDP